MKTGSIELKKLTATRLIAETVQNINWGYAAQVGSGFSISAGAPALASLDDSRVAFFDTTNDELQAYDYVSGTWTLVGSGLTISGAGGVASLARMANDQVAYIDQTNGELQAYSFSGSEWSLVGSGLGMSASATSLTGMGNNQVAMMNTYTSELQMYSFSGSEWSTLGSGLLIMFSGKPSISAFNSKDIAYFDDYAYKLRLYSFSGSQWSLTGSEYSVPSPTTSMLATLNGYDVVLGEQRAPIQFTIFRFDPDEGLWSSVSPVSSIDVGGSNSDFAITAVSGTDIALFQANEDELKTIRFKYSLSAPFFP